MKRLIIYIVPIALAAGCATVDRDQAEQLIDELQQKYGSEQPIEDQAIDEPIVEEPTVEEPLPDLPVPGRPDRPMLIGPHPRGKPAIVEYEFTLADRTRIKLRDYHVNDFWGGVPAAGWGQIIHPDGRVQGYDVNTHIRKPYLTYGYQNMDKAVAIAGHGERYYWITDDGKRLDIYRDGYQPHAEVAVNKWAIESDRKPVVSGKAEVLRWQ